MQVADIKEFIQNWTINYVKYWDLLGLDITSSYWRKNVYMGKLYSLNMCDIDTTSEDCFQIEIFNSYLDENFAIQNSKIDSRDDLMGFDEMMLLKINKNFNSYLLGIMEQILPNHSCVDHNKNKHDILQSGPFALYSLDILSQLEKCKFKFLKTSDYMLEVKKYPCIFSVSNDRMKGSYFGFQTFYVYSLKDKSNKHRGSPVASPFQLEKNMSVIIEIGNLLCNETKQEKRELYADIHNKLVKRFPNDEIVKSSMNDLIYMLGDDTDSLKKLVLAQSEKKITISKLIDFIKYY